MRRLADLGWMLSLALSAWPSSSSAQGFFSFSPGELSRPHADFEDECTKCHELGDSKTLACLSCHYHKPLADAVKAGRGLHARLGDKKCRDCHHEHKGRDNPALIDWAKVGGIMKFDHE